MSAHNEREYWEKLDKKELIDKLMIMQQQLSKQDQTLQLLWEHMNDMKRHRFGRSSERHDTEGQIAFREENGQISFFNEPEAIADTTTEVVEEDVTIIKKKVVKRKGKREEDLKEIPVVVIEHAIEKEELETIYGKDGWKELPDEIHRELRFVPAKVELEEHHIKVYAGKETDEIIKADMPSYLLRGSLVSPSLAAAIMNAKYVNAIPLYRQEQEFERYNLHIPRQNMAHWVIQCADRYLAILYDYMRSKLCERSVVQADETPTLVNKDGRAAGSKSYMWVYRTGEMEKHPIVLYDYQKTRKADHPKTFLKDFRGVCVTDGYQVYHTLSAEREDLKIAGCWSHVRRRYDEAVKALPKSSRKGCLAHKALTLIQAIFREEAQLKSFSHEERQSHRQESVRPLVEAYFAWVKEHIHMVDKRSKTGEGFQYSLNQEKYLKVFLEYGNVPMDNNAAERSIRGFCMGKKNWVMIDTVAGAKSSAIVYSITETAKANHLKPYDYLEYLLSEIPKHLDDKDRSFCERLLPWAESLPEHCRKKQ